MIRIQFGVPGVDWGNTQVARTIGLFIVKIIVEPLLSSLWSIGR